MPKLQRVNSGNVFYDNFDNVKLDKRWIVSPSLSSRYSLSERPGYLRIKHSESSTFVLTDIPQEEFMFEIKNDYKPKISTDIGGIVVFKTIDDRVELVEYYDPIIDVSRNYLYVRMCMENGVYNGYGSQDSKVWELIGSVKIEDAAKIGIVLSGESNSLAQSLDVDYAAMYKSRYIYVENLEEGMTVKLFTKNNVLIEQSVVGSNTSIATFDTFNLTLPVDGYIQLYSPTGTMLSQTPAEPMYPGDEYQFIMNIDVKFQRIVTESVIDDTGRVSIQNKVISDADFRLDEIINIGNMDSTFIEGKITVRNLDNTDIIGLQAYINLYSNTASTNLVQFAHDVIGQPANYQDRIVFDVPALSSNFFWIRITATDIQTLVRYDTFKYKLCFVNV